MKSTTRRLLCTAVGSLIAAGAINPACGKPGFTDIISVAPEKSDSSSEEIKLVKVELYTERMEFDYKHLE